MLWILGRLGKIRRFESCQGFVEKRRSECDLYPAAEVSLGMFLKSNCCRHAELMQSKVIRSLDFFQSLDPLKCDVHLMRKIWILKLQVA